MYRLLKGLTAFLSALPLPAALALGRGVGDLGYLFVRKHRRVILDQIARCMPDQTPNERRSLLRRVYRHVGQNYVEVFRWIGGRADELDARIVPVGEQHLLDAMKRGRGVLVLVAHLGNWDLMGLWSARRHPLTIISKDLRNPGVNRFWMEARRENRVGIVPARNSYRACLTALRKGGVIGFILDQNMTRDEGIFVDFFGREACTTAGLAFMSAHAGAPVVPVFMHRKPDGRHVIEFQPALDPPPGRDDASVRDATQRYTKIIEDAIRAHPDQWIWMHRRWHTKRLPPVEREAPTGVQFPT